MPLAVVGMLLLMLFMASALNRYQAHQTRVHAAVRRLEAGVNAVTGALSRSASVPLSREIRSRCAARSSRVTRRSGACIADTRRSRKNPLRRNGAERRGCASHEDVGSDRERSAFRATVRALDTLIETVSSGYTLQPIPATCAHLWQEW